MPGTVSKRTNRSGGRKKTKKKKAGKAQTKIPISRKRSPSGTGHWKKMPRTFWKNESKCLTSKKKGDWKGDGPEG